MRYATWNVVFDDENMGKVPLTFSGLLYNSPTEVAGFIPDDVDLADFAEWGAVEITAEQMLAIAQAQNPASYLLPDGRLASPIER
jgi:hypothetical protein